MPFETLVVPSTGSSAMWNCDGAAAAAEVAAKLRISARAVYDLADSGALACYRFGTKGGAIRFSGPPSAP
jgi:hypothetical protein